MEIIIKGESFNPDYFKGKPLKVCVSGLVHKYEQNTITKVWKIANGLSAPKQHDTRKESPPDDDNKD